jgi:hypothetical protein
MLRLAYKIVRYLNLNYIIYIFKYILIAYDIVWNTLFFIKRLTFNNTFFGSLELKY